jgi:hypothetical protein
LKNLLLGLPDALNGTLLARQYAWRFVLFRFTLRTGVLDFFPMLLSHSHHSLVFQIYELSHHFQRVLWTPFYALATTVALVRINDYVEFA